MNKKHLLIINFILLLLIFISGSIFADFTNVGHIDNGGYAKGVWGDGTYIYLANYDDGLRAYTFNGTTFTNVGHIDNGGYAKGVWGDGTYIYLANSIDGLRAYTFNGESFTNVGHIDNGGHGEGVWGDGTYIYLANSSDGLRAYTFNGSSFTNVGHINDIDDGAYGEGVWGDGTYIYLASYKGGLRAYTFNGTTFTNVGHIADGSSAYDIWGDGTYIYLTRGVYGLEAYTFNGSSFTCVGGINDYSYYTWSVWGDGTYIYNADDVDGLSVYTFNGSSFTNVGHINDGGNYLGVWGDGTYIYLANNDDGLRAYTFTGLLTTTITSPTNGNTYKDDELINFNSTISNGDGNYSCSWKDNGIQFSTDCTGSSYFITDTSISHTIDLNVTDGLSETASDSVTINIEQGEYTRRLDGNYYTFFIKDKEVDIFDYNTDKEYISDINNTTLRRNDPDFLSYIDSNDYIYNVVKWKDDIEDKNYLFLANNNNGISIYDITDTNINDVNSHYLGNVSYSLSGDIYKINHIELLTVNGLEYIVANALSNDEYFGRVILYKIDDLLDLNSYVGTNQNTVSVAGVANNFWIDYDYNSIYIPYNDINKTEKIVYNYDASDISINSSSSKNVGYLYLKNMNERVFALSNDNKSIYSYDINDFRNNFENVFSNISSINLNEHIYSMITDIDYNLLVLQIADYMKTVDYDFTSDTFGLLNDFIEIDSNTFYQHKNIVKDELNRIDFITKDKLYYSYLFGGIYNNPDETIYYYKSYDWLLQYFDSQITVDSNNTYSYTSGINTTDSLNGNEEYLGYGHNQVNGLLVNYPLSEEESNDTYVFDVSGNEKNAHIAYGNAVYSDDRFGDENEAMYFNDIYDYLYITDSEIQPSSNMSLSCWFKSDTTTAIAGHNIFLRFYYNSNNRFYFSYPGHGYSVINGSGHILIDFGNLGTTWHHFAVTMSGTTYKYYIDGVLVSTDNSALDLGDFVGTARFNIGGVGSNNYRFIGSVSDVRVYDRTLNESEVKRIYYNVNNKPIVSLPMCEKENVGLLIKDISGNGNDGIINNSPNYNTNYLGDENCAIAFNENYIKIDENTDKFVSSNLSVSGWFKSNITSASHNIIWRIYYNNDNRIYLAYPKGNALGGYSVINGKIQNITTTFQPDLDWHYITFTADNTIWKIYVDGELIKTINSAPNLSDIVGYPDLYIGGAIASSYFFDGSISNLRLYKRTLTENEIRDEYNNVENSIAFIDNNIKDYKIPMSILKNYDYNQNYYSFINLLKYNDKQEIISQETYWTPLFTAVYLVNNNIENPNDKLYVNKNYDWNLTYVDYGYDSDISYKYTFGVNTSKTLNGNENYWDVNVNLDANNSVNTFNLNHTLQTEDADKIYYSFVKVDRYYKGNYINSDINWSENSFEVKYLPTVTITSPADGDTYLTNENINFKNTISNGFSPYTCSWKDNGSEFSTNCDDFTQTLTTAGNTDINLTITDNLGEKASDQINITLYDPVSATITSPTDGGDYLINENISFNSTISGGDGTYACSWKDNGSEFSTDCTGVTHQISSTGTHQITLFVDDQATSTDTQTINIHLYNQVSATITSPTDGGDYLINENISFNSTISGGDGTYACSWKDNGSEFSTDCTGVTHQISSTGTHQITLFVDDQATSTDTQTINIHLYDPVSVNITSPTDGGNYYTYNDISFNSTISGGDGTYVCSWKDNGSEFSTDCTGVTHQISSTGTHTITLHADDEFIDTDNDSIDINLNISLDINYLQNPDEDDNSLYPGRAYLWRTQIIDNICNSDFTYKYKIGINDTKSINGSEKYLYDDYVDLNVDDNYKIFDLLHNIDNTMIGGGWYSFITLYRYLDETNIDSITKWSDDNFDINYPKYTIQLYDENEYSFITAPVDINVNLYEYNNNYFDFSGQMSDTENITFNSDGNKLYIEDSTDKIYQYSLSTPWDISTASYDNKYYTNTQDNDIQGITFKTDGSKMYLVGIQNDKIYQYSLSTPWDISTASYDNKSKDVSTQDNDMQQIIFKPDGEKMYLVGEENDTVYQYSLSTPWDISTASYDNKSKDVSTQDDSAETFFLNENGNKIFLGGSQNEKIYQYSLSTPWDISTASYDNISKYIGDNETGIKGLYFNNTMNKMYISGATKKIFEYDYNGVISTENEKLSDANCYLYNLDSLHKDYADENGLITLYVDNLYNKEYINGQMICDGYYDRDFKYYLAEGYSKDIDFVMYPETEEIANIDLLYTDSEDNNHIFYKLQNGDIPSIINSELQDSYTTLENKNKLYGVLFKPNENILITRINIQNNMSFPITRMFLYNYDNNNVIYSNTNITTGNNHISFNKLIDLNENTNYVLLFDNQFQKYICPTINDKLTSNLTDNNITYISGCEGSIYECNSNNAYVINSIDYVKKTEYDNIRNVPYIEMLKTDADGKTTLDGNIMGDYFAMIMDTDGGIKEIYPKTNITVKIPLDEKTNDEITPFNLTIKELLNYSLTDQNTDANFTIFPGTVDYYKLHIIDSNSPNVYIGRNYLIKMPFGNDYNENYTLQPYLLKDVDSIIPQIYVIDQIGSRIKNAKVEIYKKSGTTYNLVESQITDSIGMVSFSAYPLDEYYVYIYYENNLKFSGTIHPRTVNDVFWITINTEENEESNPTTWVPTIDFKNTMSSFNISDENVSIEFLIESSIQMMNYTVSIVQGDDVLYFDDVDEYGYSYDKNYDVNLSGSDCTKKTQIQIKITNINGDTHTFYKNIILNERKLTLIMALKNAGEDMGQPLSIVLSILFTIFVIAIISLSGFPISKTLIGSLSIIILGIFAYIGWLNMNILVLGVDVGIFYYFIAVIGMFYYMLKET